MNALGKYSGYFYAVMRIVFGLMFACHGLDHVFGAFGGKVGDSKFIFVGGWIEIVTGLFIALGLLTRPAAFLACGTMAVAYFKMHFPHSPLPIVNHGDAAVLYCLIFLYVFFHGPGLLSIDSLICSNRGAANEVGGPARVARTI